MAVTEIALLSVKHTFDLNSPELSEGPLRDIHHAISEQARYSGFPVAILQSRSTPSLIFLLGGWKSISHHMEDWIPGPINQELLKSLGEHVDVKWMFHLDREPADALRVIEGNERGEGVDMKLELFVVEEDYRPDWEVVLQRAKEDPGKVFHGRRLDLGFVADRDNVKMREVDRMVVSLVGDVPRDGPKEGLGDFAKTKEYHAVKLIELVKGPSFIGQSMSKSDL